MDYKTSFHSEKAQAAIESALIIPVVLLCIGLVLQPIIYIYSKSLCQQAAEEGVRYAMSVEDNSYVKRYVLRRLEAIPPVDIFHITDEDDWIIEIIRANNEVEVEVSGHLKPLPLLGLPSLVYLPHDNEGLFIEVQAQGPSSPMWREGNLNDWIEPYR